MELGQHKPLIHSLDHRADIKGGRMTSTTIGITTAIAGVSPCYPAEVSDALGYSMEDRCGDLSTIE